MASEIELKFLTTTDGWKQYADEPTEIKQYYLPSGTTLARDDNNVTITAPGHDPVLIPVSELQSDFLDAFTKPDEEITVGDKTELRVRSKQANEQQKLTITLKQDTEKSNTRKESQSSLNLKAFELLSGQSQGRMVVKERYKLDPKTLLKDLLEPLIQDGTISQEMYDNACQAVKEIVVDVYNGVHHSYLQANGVPKNAVLEIEFKEGTSEDVIKELIKALSQEWFATPVTSKQEKSLKNKNIAADAAAAAAEVARILGEEATQG